MPPRSGWFVLLVCTACHAQAPAGTDGTSGTSSTAAGSSEAPSTTMDVACAPAPAADWCAVGPAVALCYGDAWQVDIDGLIHKLLVGDIDGDGIADILAFNHTPPRLRTFLGVECGSPHALPMIALGEHVGPGGDVSLATTADLDGDGRTDVVLAFSDDPGSLVVFAGSAEGLKFRQRVDFGAGFTALGVGDVDGDGALDVVYPTRGAPERAAVHFGTGDGTIGPPQLLQALPSEDTPLTASILIPYFEVHDFDEDGLADLNLGVVNEGSLGTSDYEGQLMFGSGDGFFKETVTYDLLVGLGNENLSGVGDFDGDGHLDFVAPAVVYLGDGKGGFKSSAPLDFGHEYEVAPVVGDLDGDGRDDVMLHDRWHLGTADGLGPAIAVPARELRRKGDFNGDGRQDVAEMNVAEEWSANALVVRFGAPP
ncbi:VCBS repeat-containing protein [Nannocystis sp. SCPEA4]|uniref:FG-GAP repeat domain-containing protein n=1 Tax=Nannocystis sp. SCPEA4 TaxID=2996787 RepID=UPI002270613C|nr:VCBS repeat-containing protein [Nannocystis sp. SCPEA4]MCY1056434.1 VCBS repeat-containing protein [Nannocystis sp. SCPEA4]